jgi:hypothetical protein
MGNMGTWEIWGKYGDGEYGTESVFIKTINNLAIGDIGKRRNLYLEEIIML